METIDMSMFQDEPADILIGMVAGRAGPIPFVGCRYEDRGAALRNASRLNAGTLVGAPPGGVLFEVNDTGGFHIRFDRRHIPIITMDRCDAEKVDLVALAAAAVGFLVLLFGHPPVQENTLGMWTDAMLAIDVRTGRVMRSDTTEPEGPPAILH